MGRSLSLIATVMLLTPGVWSQVVPPAYPEGSAAPRGLMPSELAWLAENPLAVPEAVTPPPEGPVHCAAEYEPMEALLMAWEGTTSWKTILRTMAQHVTTTGNADVYMVVDSSAEQTSAQASLAAGGVNMSRVNFVVRTTDTIWIRDYGPRYIYQGGCRAIVDHTYNRPRPMDNLFNSHFSTVRGHALYELPLVHGGGNFHLDALGRSRTSRLINIENPSLTETQIHDIWQDYQNVTTTFYNPIPTYVDATSHIDMWMQVIGDNAVVISDWPLDVGSAQDVICDAAAVSMAAEGYTVHRVPARSVSGTHYTYTNVVMCNDLVLVPSYTNSSVIQHNAQAQAAWQAAVPTKTVVMVNCQAIVSAAGVMHCIVMHVPAYLGGSDPTAYLINLNGGEVLTPGTQTTIRWVTDDDDGVSDVDIWLSLDGGVTFSTMIAAAIPDSGSYQWTVPSNCSPNARIRIVARDVPGNTGWDDSNASFVITGAPCPAASNPYGTGKAGLNGVPTLSANPPVLGTMSTLQLTNALPGGLAYLLIGASPAAVPFDGGTVLVLFTDYPSLVVPAWGGFNIPMGIPNDPAFVGLGVYLQVWTANDPGASGLGWTCTNGLELRLGY